MHAKVLDSVRWLMRPGGVFFILTASSATLGGSGLSVEKVEFFEKQIRPILIERCYACHNSADTQEGGLALDHRGAVLAGGQSGPAIAARSDTTTINSACPKMAPNWMTKSSTTL